MGYIGSTSAGAIVLGASTYGYLFREIAPGAPFVAGGLSGLLALTIYVVLQPMRAGRAPLTTTSPTQETTHG